jgi:hypothetical protein
LADEWAWGIGNMMLTEKTEVRGKIPLRVPCYHESHVDWFGAEARPP